MNSTKRKQRKKREWGNCPRLRRKSVLTLETTRVYAATNDYNVNIQTTLEMTIISLLSLTKSEIPHILILIPPKEQQSSTITNILITFPIHTLNSVSIAHSLSTFPCFSLPISLTNHPLFLRLVSDSLLIFPGFADSPRDLGICFSIPIPIPFHPPRPLSPFSFFYFFSFLI